MRDAPLPRQTQQGQLLCGMPSMINRRLRSDARCTNNNSNDKVATSIFPHDVMTRSYRQDPIADLLRIEIQKAARAYFRCCSLP